MENLIADLWQNLQNYYNDLVALLQKMGLGILVLIALLITTN